MATEEVKRICPKCGRVLEEDFVSCPYCGKSLTAEPKKKSKHGLSRISIILGVASFIVFGLPLGFCAIIVGAVAVGKGDDRGYIGIVLGIVGAALAVILTSLFFLLFIINVK